MNYLKHVWYCAALTDELTTTPLARIVCDTPMVLFRTESGRCVALEDRCSHRQAPLSMGRVFGETIECGYHGFTFDCAGQCVHIPHQERVPAAAQIRHYPTAERHGLVWLWVGDAASPDYDRLPMLPGVGEEGHRTVYLRFHAKANFQLMADNLMDNSHADFLHRDSIGSYAGRRGQEDTPRVEMESRIEGEQVYFKRVIRNTMVGRVVAKWAGTDAPLDRINISRWEPPNTVHIRLELKNNEADAVLLSAHIMTPETADTTHYFLTWTRNFNLDNESYPTDDQVRVEQSSLILNEDIPIIEAQQRTIEAFGKPDVPAAQDRFVVSVHRVLQEIYSAHEIEPPASLLRGSPRRAIAAE